MSIGLAGPNAFDGHLTITDYQIQQLGEVMGLAAADASALRGTISSSMSFKGDLRNATAMAMDLDVAPIDATVFDVPIALARGLRATMTGGRLQLEDGTMTIGGIAVRAGGAFAIDRPEGKLVLDLDGDIGTLQPWLRRANRTRELAAAGRITGHLEAERFAAGLAVTGSLNTTLSTLSSGDKTLAQDVRVAIDLTGQRAEVREVAADRAWWPARGHWRSAAGLAERVAPCRLADRATSDRRARHARRHGVVRCAGTPRCVRSTPMEALGGAVDLSAKLTSSRPDLMAIAGDVRLERAQVTAKELTYAQSDVTRFRLSEGALTIESLDWRGPGSKVIGRGSVGLAPGVENDVRLDVDTELGIIGALLSGRATGRLAGNVELRGPSGASRLDRGGVPERCLVAGAGSAHSLRGLVRPHSLDGRRSVADEARRDGQWRDHPHRRSAATPCPGRRRRPDDRRARHPDRCAARPAQPARRRLGLAAVGGGRDAAGEGGDHRQPVHRAGDAHPAARELARRRRPAARASPRCRPGWRARPSRSVLPSPIRS